jgi:hypothetical protein
MSHHTIPHFRYVHLAFALLAIVIGEPDGAPCNHRSILVARDVRPFRDYPKSPAGDLSCKFASPLRSISGPVAGEGKPTVQLHRDPVPLSGGLSIRSKAGGRSRRPASHFHVPSKSSAGPRIFEGSGFELISLTSVHGNDATDFPSAGRSSSRLEFKPDYFLTSRSQAHQGRGARNRRERARYLLAVHAETVGALATSLGKTKTLGPIDSSFS